jgi:hypothetical protein
MSSVNPFIDTHAPMLWENLLVEFGRTVDYWLDNDPLQAMTLPVIWKEGVEDEEVSPGRYSHIWVQNNSLPRLPKLGDAVAKEQLEYDVVRIDATAYGFSRLVLQERGNGF